MSNEKQKGVSPHFAAESLKEGFVVRFRFLTDRRKLDKWVTLTHLPLVFLVFVSYDINLWLCGFFAVVGVLGPGWLLVLSLLRPKEEEPLGILGLILWGCVLALLCFFSFL